MNDVTHMSVEEENAWLRENWNVLNLQLMEVARNLGDIQRTLEQHGEILYKLTRRGIDW